MSFRAKCPTCGRRQSLQESDIGHTTWCVACGNRFVVEWAPPEAETGDSSIPDIDFPVDFGSPAAAPPQTPAFSSIAPPPPLPVPPPPLPPLSLRPPPTPMIQPASVPVIEPTFTQPQPIEQALPASRLIPILIGAVAVLTVAVVGGLIAIVYLLNHEPAPVTQATPAPVHVQPVSLPAPVKPPEVPASPATLPIVPTPPVVEETPKRETIPAPVVVIPEPPKLKFRPVRAAVPDDLDDQIGKSLDRGVNYLLSQFVNGKLREADARSQQGPGMDALAVYALLQAGEATHDLRLGPNSPDVGKMLDAVKELSMDDQFATYSHSLRAAALGVYHRASDKTALRADSTWLISAEREGAYTYRMPPPVNNAAAELRGRFRIPGDWDNSNSQYGALGVWASLEAGCEVPGPYWQAIEKHWLSCQLPDGEWAYRGYGEMGRMSMTVAGITTLFVAEDQLDQRAVVTNLGHEPFSPALLHGLNWLEAGNNSVKLPGGAYHTYALFGLERAALASGFKYFGTHDWYRELAAQQIETQAGDGSWSSGENPVIDTSYTLLFLSRGRHPIFMNKLRFDGFWANRPRDIANLSHYASTVLERPINWQVVSLKSNWSDWMDSPVLYIASHETVKFTDEDCNKLRAYAQNGGLIFTHADGDMPAFNKSIAELSKRLFPQYPLLDLPSTHPIFSTLYKIKQQPRLQGVSNGSRLLLLNSPTDLDKSWQLRDWVQRPTNFQMGINIFIYAAGKANLRNKLKTPLVAESDTTPILTSSIAELKYVGDFNPEPAGLPRFAKLFKNDTSVKLDVVDADPNELDPQKILLAHLTGTNTFTYTTGQMKAIHDYVDNGGILLVDACGASSNFLKSVIGDFLPHTFPQTYMQDMQADHPILAGKGLGMTPVNLRLRPFRTEQDGTTTQPIQFITVGKGLVIFSPIDMTTGFLGTATWGINGYEPSTVYDLVKNALLFTLEKQDAN